jgi:cation diffusion facilitator CzcD-associated flavoprotein CzcO
MKNARKSPKKRIVILGGGFGGVYAALHLKRLAVKSFRVFGVVRGGCIRVHLCPSVINLPCVEKN